MTRGRWIAIVAVVGAYAAFLVFELSQGRSIGSRLVNLALTLSLVALFQWATNSLAKRREQASLKGDDRPWPEGKQPPPIP